MGDLTEHFSLSEFGDPDHGRTWNHDNLARLATQLEVIREALGGHGLKITPAGGCRTEAQAKARSPNVKDSQHTHCTAADFRALDGRGGYIPTPVVYATVEALIKGKHILDGGLGLYPGFVHYDVRDGRPQRWKHHEMKDVAVPTVFPEDVSHVSDAPSAPSTSTVVAVGAAAWLIWWWLS